MGHREVRRVHRDWRHPKRNGQYIPLLPDFKKRLAEWDEGAEKWNDGFRQSFDGKEWIPKEQDLDYSYEEFAGPRPVAEKYMPEWPESQKTHFQLYEVTTEGTPDSPPMASQEDLARWLVENDVSAFADLYLTYDEWLGFIRYSS